jgi:hypothetical protein
MNSKRAAASPASSDAAENPDYQLLIEELRTVASAVSEDPAVVSSLEDLLSQRLGVDVRHVRSEVIIPPASDLRRYIANRRTQSRHWLAIPEQARLPGRFEGRVHDGCLSIFLKAGRNIRKLAVDELLNGVDCADACLPFYFGAFKAEDRMLAAWEAFDGEHIAFDALSPELGRKLMEAVASVNAIPSADFAGILSDDMRWIVAPLDYYEQIYSQRMSDDQRQQWREAFAKTAKLVHADGELVRRVRGLGGGLLTHNDINPNNVLFSSEGQVAIVDWEGASLGFPGADLRFLQRLEAKDALLDCYVERANALGLDVRREDVLAGYRIAEGMRKVYRGWGVMSLGPVLNGLALVESVLDKRNPD